MYLPQYKDGLESPIYQILSLAGNWFFLKKFVVEARVPKLQKMNECLNLAESSPPLNWLSKKKYFRKNILQQYMIQHQDMLEVYNLYIFSFAKNWDVLKQFPGEVHVSKFQKMKKCVKTAEPFPLSEQFSQKDLFSSICYSTRISLKAPAARGCPHFII